MPGEFTIRYAMPTPADPATYIISLEEMAWGGFLVGLTLIIHGLGMLSTLHFTTIFRERFGASGSFLPCLANLILASWCITFVHFLEVMMWAGFFQWHGCFATNSTAFYFALMDYTTVGSAFNLPQRWRLLEGMIATAGLLGFAWSTGVLMTLAQEFQTQQLQRLRQHRSKSARPAPHIPVSPSNPHP